MVYFTSSKRLSSDFESFSHFIAIIIVVDGAVSTIDDHRSHNLDVCGDRVQIKRKSSQKIMPNYGNRRN